MLLFLLIIRITIILFIFEFIMAIASGVLAVLITVIGNSLLFIKKVLTKVSQCVMIIIKKER